MGHAYLTYLGRSLKFNNFWVNFGPQGRFEGKRNSVPGSGEHRETGTLVQIGFQPSSSDPFQFLRKANKFPEASYRMEDDFCPPMPYTLGYSATSDSTDSFDS